MDQLTWRDCLDDYAKEKELTHKQKMNLKGHTLARGLIAFEDILSRGVIREVGFLKLL